MIFLLFSILDFCLKTMLYQVIVDLKINSVYCIIFRKKCELNLLCILLLNYNYIISNYRKKNRNNLFYTFGTFCISRSALFLYVKR